LKGGKGGASKTIGSPSRRGGGFDKIVLENHPERGRKLLKPLMGEYSKNAGDKEDRGF